MSLHPPHSSPTVGVVIPAFNEANNLHTVLTAVSNAGWLSRAIIVNDGSVDDTVATVMKYATEDSRMELIDLPVNRGKAGAMFTGVQALNTDLVIFLDADLLYLKSEHIQSLQRPVVDGSCDMSIALFRHGRFYTNLSHRLTPNLSGQRCLWRDEAEKALQPVVDTRFGVEMALTRYARAQGWRIQRVYWTGVSHRTKEEKRHGLSRISSRWQMYREIAGVLAGQ